MVMQQRYKRLGIWGLVIIGLLTIPFIATRLSDEVNWELGDFLIMGGILSVMALAFELIAQRKQKTMYKLAFAVGLLGAFLLFWVNAAVGIIGNEGQPANLLYAAVLAVGLIGSLLARFNAKGMSITLFMAAITQMLVPVIAYLIWPPPETSWSPSVFGVFLMTTFFAIIFLISGLLFRKAARTKETE